PPSQPLVSPQSGFAYSRAQFQQYVEDALTFARSLGASDAAVEVSEGVGLSVSVRKGESENVERNRDKSMSITVYAGQRRGNASAFRGGYASSRHSLSVAPIASTPGRRGDDMQRDAWYTSMRAPSELAAPEAVGRYAAERALSRLKSRKIKTCEVPVLFESS